MPFDCRCVLCFLPRVSAAISHRAKNWLHAKGVSRRCTVLPNIQVPQGAVLHFTGYAAFHLYVNRPETVATQGSSARNPS